MLNRLLEVIVAVLMAATVVIGFAAVVARYVVGQSLGWSYEAMQALLVYMTFVSAYLALRRGAHLKIDVLVRMMPISGQTVLFLLNQAIIAAVGFVMFWWGGEQALRFWSRETLVLELPLGPLYGIIPLAGLGILIEALIVIPAGLRRARAGEAPDQVPDAFGSESGGSL
ncbi:TRAP transporter small permease [Rhodoligotrophos defluvii]|uniref:TRAP transporter small permease n=1 Tax=Rhodoligotrophos defluvii TaxID=2561934 RepID=UPI0010C972D1|nr:TRAP transporter small permease [Rhodoligotrophos defluvii]